MRWAGRWRLHSFGCSSRCWIQNRVIADLGERERQEHVDRVHDDELAHVTAACRAARRARRRPSADAVAHREPLGERGEAVRQPRVGRHVGHDARAVDEARLRGDEEQRALADERGDDEAVPDAARRPWSSAPATRSKRTAFIVLSSARAWRARAGSRGGCRPR